MSEAEFQVGPTLDTLRRMSEEKLSRLRDSDPANLMGLVALDWAAWILPLDCPDFQVLLDVWKPCDIAARL